jgi:YidC/Oxa1 family membrane protein insertase
MDKRTLAFIVLSIVIIFGFFMVQNAIMPAPTHPSPIANSTPNSAAATPSPSPTANAMLPVAATPQAAKLDIKAAKDGVSAKDSGGKAIGKDKVGAVASAAAATSTAPAEVAKDYSLGSKVFSATFNSAGGDLVSLKLLEHKNKDGKPVEMILGPPNVAAPRAMMLAFGVSGDPLADVFTTKGPESGNGSQSIAFSHQYTLPAAKEGDAPLTFVLTKRYTILDNAYAIKLDVTLEGADGKDVPGMNFDGSAYHLIAAPQIGPYFQRIDGNYEYRHYFGYGANGRAGVDPNKNEFPKETKWAAIVGKYFVYIAQAASSASDNISGALNVRYAFTAGNVGSPSYPLSGLSIYREALSERAKPTTDSYYFYYGPKTQAALDVFSDGAKNGFSLGGAHYVDVIEGDWLGWLEDILKFFLVVFHYIVPNWGIAIILLTIMVRAILFPLTFKGSMATSRMQALTPKINEIREKYKDNPKKMNELMAELYRTEKANPLSGCLPMLIQIPIFFAMYYLFNNQFDLRGALFIPGWIPDLSMGDSVLEWSAGIPILGWTHLRLLPFIYVGSQLLYAKFTTQPTAGSSQKQMQLMMYAMPIIFFFILYDAPSGLTLYWISTNVLTIVQQMVINNILKKRNMLPAGAASQSQASEKKAIAGNAKTGGAKSNPGKGGGKKAKR